MAGSYFHTVVDYLFIIYIELRNMLSSSSNSDTTTTVTFERAIISSISAVTVYYANKLIEIPALSNI